MESLSTPEIATLRSKLEIDFVIRNTTDKVLLLAFVELEKDYFPSFAELCFKAQALLIEMCDIYFVDSQKASWYQEYFQIQLLPSSLFFFNTHHIKIEFGTADNTKYVGPFNSKGNIVDLVEAIFRGCMKGKVLITSPLPYYELPQYSLVFKDI
eukprot:GCRY01007714.1.p1 GENE.GCRY01007714.1~~GCRY01007714.1.p1  ORF type:complete len:154 (+),score=20.32 GCRY01007714.1:90-551(+)